MRFSDASVGLGFFFLNTRVCGSADITGAGWWCWSGGGWTQQTVRRRRRRKTGERKNSGSAVLELELQRKRKKKKKKKVPGNSREAHLQLSEEKRTKKEDASLLFSLLFLFWIPCQDFQRSGGESTQKQVSEHAVLVCFFCASFARICLF